PGSIPTPKRLMGRGARISVLSSWLAKGPCRKRSSRKNNPAMDGGYESCPGRVRKQHLDRSQAVTIRLDRQVGSRPHCYNQFSRYNSTPGDHPTWMKKNAHEHWN